jgi:hypothetical protein
MMMENNYPNETLLYIDLRGFSDDALSEVLRTNQHVKRIKLYLGGLENNTNWDLSLSVVATRENLEGVCLEDRPYDVYRNPPERVAPFVLAIQQNPRVQSVGLIDLQLSGNSLASFIDTATSVSTLEISECGMDASAGARVAAALQRNTSVQRLILGVHDEMFIIPILSSLAYNKSVRELVLPTVFHYPSLATSRAVGCLLEGTATIHRFEFGLQCEYPFDIHVGEDNFRPIAQGLIQNKAVTEVKFERCIFGDREEVLLLNSILESKSNLQSLALTYCSVQHLQEEFHTAVFSLLQPHSLLRSLELSHQYNFGHYGFATTQDTDQFWTAVERSPLEHISIGRIVLLGSCLALIASIPKIQVRTLEFNLHHDLQYMKRDIILAIERNASLRSVFATVEYNQDWLDQEDMKKLISYSERNQFLAQWIENPNLVPNPAWPEYLAVAQTTGPDTVFCILLALAPTLERSESEVVVNTSLNRIRKCRCCCFPMLP